MSRTVRRIVSDMRSRGARAQIGSDAMKRADPSFMRQHNRLLVLNYVREHGPIARAAIARQTGLSRTTVSSIMDDLLREGFVLEGEMQDATPSGGRRAILVNFNAAAGYIVGIDLGRSHFTLLLTDLAAELVAKRAGPFHTESGPDVCLPALLDELITFLAEQGVELSQVIGAGVGIPGPMDSALHKLYSPPRMPGWHGVDVERILRQRLGIPVYVENDANAGALGESRYGAGRGVADLVYVKVGTGIGAALVINGQIYRGSRGSAGEIGHVSIDENGPRCACGNRGCLEAMAGGGAIVEEARSLLVSEWGRSTTDGPTGDSAMALADELDIARVVQAALDGDGACRTAIAHAGEHIGVALAGLVNLVNPSLVLLDGGVVRAGELLLGPIRRAVAARSLAAASRYSRIATGALSDNAIALGGVVTVIDAAFGPSSPASLPPRSGPLPDTSAADSGRSDKAAEGMAIGLRSLAAGASPARNLASEGYLHLSP
jgi:predicted NBD/HSP70 family sugar kinase